MGWQIQPLRDGDVDRLGAYLYAGLGPAPGSEYADPRVLAWKYLDSMGTGSAPRSLVAWRGDEIVGHIGSCLTTFAGVGDGSPEVPALHLIDWLADSHRAPVALPLLFEAVRAAAVQYNIGGTPRANAIQLKVGYRQCGAVDEFRRILNLPAALRVAGAGPAWKRPLRMARSALRTRPVRLPGSARGIMLARVSAFGAEVQPILHQSGLDSLISSRHPALLNHFLRHPYGRVSGWHLLDSSGTMCGVAMGSVIPQGNLLAGKILECLLADTARSLCGAAVAAVVRELRTLGADVVYSYAGSARLRDALRENGFHRCRQRPFLLRDPEARLAPGSSFYLTGLDGDYAIL